MSGVPESVNDAVNAVASTGVLLVAVDFDGTLAPLVDDPESSRMLPAAQDALLQLDELPDTRVAIVSGRALDVLERLTSAPASVALIGSHGSESRLDGAVVETTLGERERERLTALNAIIASVADRFEGALFEPKPAGAGLHTRRSSRADAAQAEELALRLVAELERNSRDLGRSDGELVIRRGKDILEFSWGEADKGTALLGLRRAIGATGVIFIGDDVTDEDGFAVLRPGDVGIKVGAGESAAEFRLENPAAVAELLELLARARRTQRPVREEDVARSRPAID